MNRAPKNLKTKDVFHRWSIADSVETYHIRNWGGEYFGINEKGHLQVHPQGADDHAIDLKGLVDELTQRGISLPILIRFSDILKSRIERLNECFHRAIEVENFRGSYRGVYPIKVNQQRQVVEEIIGFGKPYSYGLEAGSKPELLAVLAMLNDPDALVICNGYKDEAYVETALLGSRLGRRVILVIEKPSELALVRSVSERTGVTPVLGMRAKLSARGSGRWESSGGDRSKFGLSAREMLQAVEQLKEWGMLECLQLMHFHLGSQISSIRAIKNALREAGRFYVELSKMAMHLKYFDVGGGLGVDYDGSQSNFSSSMNYTVQEYANDVVNSVMEVCDAEGIEHPTIVTESGRAVVAHHAVLVVNVLGVTELASSTVPDVQPEDALPILHNLFGTYRDITRKNYIESYHDAVQYKEECLTLFQLGHLSLQQRVTAENIFWGICKKLLRIVRDDGRVPEELEGLEQGLSDTYFCNFSAFQSLPDSWAVDQLFPIMPIHRLDEAPTRRGILADITCDSDGKIDRFIDLHDVKNVLELHADNGEDYYLGVFLVGAYQEILGDLHNLFGDTNAVHVGLDDDGKYRIDHVIEGDTVTDVLRYVSYSKEDIMSRVRRAAEDALRGQRMTIAQSRQLLKMFDDGMAGYTYLESE